MKEELIKLDIGTGAFLALWKYTDPDTSVDKNILLTHGTFSNKRVLQGISEFFVSKGFTCWVFEWIGHGDSSKASEPYNFESIGLKDFQVVFSYLFEECEIPRVDCIVHSGGGIALSIALIESPKFKVKINSITMFGSQAFGAAYTNLKFLRIFIGKYCTYVLGIVPAKLIGGIENESYFMMKQWFDWNLSKNFIGTNGSDYKPKLSEIRIPILSIAGGGDRFIAPYEGCLEFIDSFENAANQIILCSRDNGFRENYNHARLIHSRNAVKEIYPLVLDWITKDNR